MEQKRRIDSDGVLRTGARHLQEGMPCEDVLVRIEEPDFCFFGLADGQSGKRFGAAGGRASLDAVAAYVRRQGIEKMADYPFPDEFPCLMMREIRAGLRSVQAGRGGAYGDYASTLLAVGVDPVSDRYVFAHLGDGCLLAVREDGSLVLLSPPENGFTAQYTWLTTSENAVSHLQIGFGSLRGLKRMVLLTDGAACLCRGRNIPRPARELLQSGSRMQILELLKASDHADDASCIVLDVLPG